MNIVVLSGGMDSTTALAVARTTGPTRAITIDYGQRHRTEIRYARAVADHYHVDHRVIDITGMLSDSALTGEAEVPDGKYDHQSMEITVVPGRNLLFAAAVIAQAREGDQVWVGVHAGDHTIYPDCRPPFWRAVNEAAEAYGVMVVTPFITVSKAQIVAIASINLAPLDLTWSCYKGGDTHCGRCGTCVERAEAFALAGVIDPTVYEDNAYWREAVGAV